MEQLKKDWPCAQMAMLQSLRSSVCLLLFGCCLTRQKLARPKVKGLDLDGLKAIVADNAKQRFALQEEDGVLWIRANQGHSLAVSLSDLSRYILNDPAGGRSRPETYHQRGRCTNSSAWDV